MDQVAAAYPAENGPVVFDVATAAVVGDRVGVMSIPQARLDAVFTAAFNDLPRLRSTDAMKAVVRAVLVADDQYRLKLGAHERHQIDPEGVCELCEPVSVPVEEPPRADDFRERHARRVREVWVAWAERQPNPKPSWLVPYDDLTDADKEADRCIGAALWGDGFAEGVEVGASAAALRGRSQTDRVPLLNGPTLDAAAGPSGVVVPSSPDESADRMLRTSSVRAVTEGFDAWIVEAVNAEDWDAVPWKVAAELRERLGVVEAERDVLLAQQEAARARHSASYDEMTTRASVFEYERDRAVEQRDALRAKCDSTECLAAEYLADVERLVGERDALRAAGSDLWNEIENLRAHWEGTVRASFIEEYIARWEAAADTETT